MRFIFIIGLLFWGWAEISAFIVIGSEIGGLFSLLGIFLTAFFGIALLKNQGLSVLHQIRRDISKGQAPVTSIADSVSLVVGGLLMLIPGYVTDSIGLFLFIPVLRTIFGVHLLRWIGNSNRFTSFVDLDGGYFRQKGSPHSNQDKTQDHFSFAEQRQQQDNSDDIIEGEFEERPYLKSQLQQKNKKQS